MSTMTLPPLCFQDAQWHYPQTTSSPPASLHSPRHLYSSAWNASPIWDSPPRATGSPRSNVDRNIWSPGAGSPSGAFADRSMMRGHAPPAPRSTSSFNPFEDDDSDDAPSLKPSRFQSTVGHLSSSSCPASQPAYRASAVPPPIKVPSLPLLDLNFTSGAGTAQIQTPSVVRLADDPMTISIPSAEPSSLDPRGDVARTLLTRGNKHRARTTRCDEPRYYQKSSLSAVIHG
ncbi:hypothetical protein BDZ89DRAFT_1075227 [Hymenopellis radicata]|nr:hypothetical protein BDZ89DRAFT_1075227 [Hymenopellis radicata]